MKTADVGTAGPMPGTSVLLSLGARHATLDETIGSPCGHPDRGRSLVLGGVGQENDWTARRNDGADPSERQLYYGPNGRLYYDDGSAVQFDSVKKQLQDLRAEERISPR
jgi:hypothetical protein